MTARSSIQLTFLLLLLTLIGCGYPNKVVQKEEASFIEVDGGTKRHLPNAVEAGARVEETFILKNMTNEAITVKNLRTSCGCSKAELTSSEIAARGSITLKVLVNSAYRDVKVQAVVIMFDVASASSETSLNIWLEFEVSMPWEITPKMVQFSGVPKGDLRGKFYIHPHKNKDMNILNISSLLEGFSYKLDDIKPDDTIIPISFSGTFPQELGAHRFTINVLTDDKIIPSQSVDLTTTTIQLNSISPNQIIFNVKNGEEKIKKSMIFTTQEPVILGNFINSVGIQTSIANYEKPSLYHKVDFVLDSTKFNAGFNKFKIQLTSIDGATSSTVYLDVIVTK